MDDIVGEIQKDPFTQVIIDNMQIEIKSKPKKKGIDDFEENLIIENFKKFQRNQKDFVAI